MIRNSEKFLLPLRLALSRPRRLLFAFCSREFSSPNNGELGRRAVCLRLDLRDGGNQQTFFIKKVFSPSLRDDAAARNENVLLMQPFAALLLASIVLVYLKELSKSAAVSLLSEVLHRFSAGSARRASLSSSAARAAS